MQSPSEDDPQVEVETATDILKIGNLEGSMKANGIVLRWGEMIRDDRYHCVGPLACWSLLVSDLDALVAFSDMYTFCVVMQLVV